MAIASSYKFMAGAAALLSSDPTNWLATPTTASQTGTSAADRMRDAIGGTLLIGSAGDDSYYIGDYRTRITEAAGEGHDTVYSFISYTADANVENVVLLKTGATATGNSLGNLLITKVDGTTLDGGAGDDVLADESSGGVTTFKFAAGSGKDVAYGFTSGSGAGHDLVRLEGLGVSSFADLAGKISQVGADTLLTFSAADSLLLRNTTAGSLTAANFAFQPTLVGAYVGNTPADFAAYESWLGGPADIVGLHTGRASWADWQGSLDWLIGLWKNEDATKAWTLPLFPVGGSLATGASGGYNSYYVKAAQSLAASKPTGDILVRTGVEFNGNWMPWAAQGKEAQFAENFRQFVNAFRSVSDRFVFEWNVNVGDDWGVNAEAAYPGDAYVDIIGMDFYFDTQWYPADPLQAWNQMVNQGHGLAWFEAFAAAHGKPTAYSEWGVNTDNAGPYIEKFAEWLASHNVAYQIYWNSNAAFSGDLDNGQYPNAAAAYLAAFGEAPYAPPYALDPAQVPGPTSPPPPPPDTITSSSSTTLPAGVANLVLTGSAGISGTGNGLDNTITGNSGNNALSGLAGNDLLIGGTGADSMTGGLGDDTFRVDNTSDKTIEKSGEGDDSVFSTVTFTLSDHVERLVLEGSSNINGTGNGLANQITGNGGANKLKGNGGDDILIGGAGADSFDGDSGNDTLKGDDGADYIEGDAGNDILDGGAGADTMKGGDDNDTYYVDNSGDKITEDSGDGTDLVISGITYTLPSNVENLTFRYAGACWGYGNSLANVMTGNSGDNMLDGASGNDTLDGAAGADRLVGGSGNDRLTGGEGVDTFVFLRGSGRDTVVDFGADGAADVIDISAYKSAGYTAKLTDVGADCVISFTSGETITLAGVHATDLVATAAGYAFG